MVEVALLGEHPHLVAQVGELRWSEWGYDDPTAERWPEVTASESQVPGLPITLVAIDDAGKAAGAVAPTRDFYVGCDWTVREELTLTQGGWLNVILERTL